MSKITQFFSSSKIKLNHDQEEALKIMKTGKNVLITGSGGVGKSVLIESYYDYAINKYSHSVVYKTSTTGISAIQIGGKTIHSWAGIQLGKDSVEEILKNMIPIIRFRWKRTRVLFIDEISMLHPDIFDKLDKIARIIKCNDAPFGGIQLIVSGDWYQLPVVKCEKFCFESEVWNEVINETVILTENMRQEDPNFQEILEEIRLGVVSDKAVEMLESRIGKDITVKIENNDFKIEPTKLFPKNVDVNRINSRKLREQIELQQDKNPNVPTTEISRTFHAQYKMFYNKTHMSNKKIIESFMRQRQIVDDEITLVEGAQVMFKKNITLLNVANGTRGVVSGFTPSPESGDYVPIVTLLDGTTRIVDLQEFVYSNKSEFKCVKYQIPLKLAWATTIHASQGATLDSVQTDIGNDIFEFGQAYVVLSRVRTLEGLTLKSFNPKKIRAHPKVLDHFN